jgi:hypothetical protein
MHSIPGLSDLVLSQVWNRDPILQLRQSAAGRLKGRNGCESSISVLVGTHAGRHRKGEPKWIDAVDDLSTNRWIVLTARECFASTLSNAASVMCNPPLLKELQTLRKCLLKRVPSILNSLSDIERIEKCLHMSRIHRNQIQILTSEVDGSFGRADSNSPGSLPMIEDTSRLVRLALPRLCLAQYSTQADIDDLRIYTKSQSTIRRLSLVKYANPRQSSIGDENADISNTENSLSVLLHDVFSPKKSKL